MITVEPRFSVSFGTGYYDGFRVLYESGGSRYWTYTPHHPGHVIVLPPRVQHVHHHHHRHGRWDDRRHWNDRDDGWRGDRHHRHDREHRRY